MSVPPAGLRIRPDTRYTFRFNKRSRLPAGYAAHRGQIVTVTEQIPDTDLDPATGPQFRVVAKDGWVGTAYQEELEPLR